MNQNKIVEKLKDLLEIEVALAEKQFVKNPLLKDQLLELLEVQKFVAGVKEVPLIYA